MNTGKFKSVAHIEPLRENLTAAVVVPGSKSYSNRALIIAALANGKSILSGCSSSNDTQILIRALQQLGMYIVCNRDEISIMGNSGRFNPFYGTIEVEDAGTVMRFLTALCCIVPGEIILKGSARMHERPIKGLVDALLQLGADIEYMGKNGFPPLKIRGGKLHGGKVEIDASQSSQFISALMMISPMIDSPLEIILTGGISSAPYIGMTISIMQHFGALIRQEREKYLVSKNKYSATNYIVESDASSAAYFFALAAITQSTIQVDHISYESLQGDIKFVDLLEQMGCKVSRSISSIRVTGPQELKAIIADMKNMQDVAQTLAVVAAFAKGTSILKGLKNLELKETNRLTALQKELTKMGIECTTDGEQIRIVGGSPRGAFINTYNDHRMAMSFAIAGARIGNMQIESPEAVKKSFPDFWDMLKNTGMQVNITTRSLPIILIGFMGAGKTTVGKLLSKKLQLPLWETDEEILQRSGFKSIPEIFEIKGESFFRELEKEVLYDLSEKSNGIISCGGGVIISAENREILKKNGNIIFLSASFETITERIHHEISRPLFKGIEKAKELYSMRLSLYQDCADEIIATDNMSPEEIANSIISKIKIA